MNKNKVYFTAYMEVNGFLFHLEDANVELKDIRSWVKDCVKHHTGYRMKKTEVDSFVESGEFVVEMTPNEYVFHYEKPKKSS